MALEVGGEGHVRPSPVLEKGRHGIGLVVTDLDEECAAAAQETRRTGHETADEVEPIRAAIERDLWFVIVHLDLKTGNRCRRDVGWVGGDEFEDLALLEYREKIAVSELDAVGDFRPLRVLAGKGKGFRGNIRGYGAPGRACGKQGDRDDAGTGPEVEHGGRLVARQERKRPLDEKLGLVTWNEGALVLGEDDPAELNGADNVLEGFACRAAFHERAEAVEIGLGEGAFELDIEIHAAEAEDVGEEEFDIESWGGNARLLEKGRGLLDQFKNCHCWGILA